MPGLVNVTPAFVLAGDATITVSNGQDTHFTYNIYKADPTPEYPKEAFFVSVLSGPDVYLYMGKVEVRIDKPSLDPMIKLTSRSRVKHTADSYRVGQWALRAIWQVARGTYTMPEGYSIKHDGRCGRCGRALTHPASLDTGLGPECADQLGVEWAEKVPQGAKFDFDGSKK